MTQIARLPREAAKFNPASVYKSPRDIIGEVLMTRGEKVATLERWREEIIQQMTASDEGMPINPQPGILGHTLQKIDATIEALSTRDSA